jgi:hypothetical protein
MAVTEIAGAGNTDLVVFPGFFSRDFQNGILMLWRALQFSQNAGLDRSQFAVEIQDFYELLLTTNDLRWLVAKGLAEHAQETSALGDIRRSFQPTTGLTFTKATVFFLTESGATLASKIHAWALKNRALAFVEETQRAPETCAQTPASKGNGAPKAEVKPTWDTRRRELRVGELLVKWFRVPAPNQEVVLSAFEEENWPAIIDDPLPCKGEIVARQRLSYAITRLNGKQVNHLIHFHSDGRGEGIGWTLLATNATNIKGKSIRGVNGKEFSYALSQCSTDKSTWLAS